MMGFAEIRGVCDAFYLQRPAAAGLAADPSQGKAQARAQAKVTLWRAAGWSAILRLRCPAELTTVPPVG
ncbi:MAG: hypothetical protein AB1700_17150, partial [Bacillota bacterium]